MQQNTSPSQASLTVSEITQAIKLSLESTFPRVWIRGEISNFKRQSSGHMYFSLKDANAQISAVMFRGDTASLRAMPKDGDHVLVRGEINVYPPRGAYQVIIRELTLEGLGELLLKLEQLKIKLKQLGWFEKARKKPLPRMPRRIGIVTSPTGAAIQDMLNVLGRRFAGVHLILNPVKVQGEGSAAEIAQAIDQFNRYDLVDVMIIGRGGGSIEDLWAFNEEVVAQAIFNSRIPVICAVGHETDHCIADYVADVRAPTPSAAAEIVIAEKAHHLQHLAQLRHRLMQTMMHLVKQGKHRLEGLKRQPVLLTPYALLGGWMQKIDDLRCDVDVAMVQHLKRKRLELEGYRRQLEALKPTNQIAYLKQKFETLQKALERQMQQRLLLYRERLSKLASTLYVIDPKNLLKKGYTILFSEKDGSVITSVRSLEVEQQVKILLSDGQAKALIEEVE